MEYLAYVIILIVGILIGLGMGILIGTGRMRRAVEEGSVGNLRIDRSEPNEPPKAYLEVYTGGSIESISHKRFVMLKVVNEDYVSRG